MLLLVSFLPEDAVTAWQSTLIGVVGTGFLSTVAKVWSENGLTGRLLGKMLGTSLVLLMLSGCAIQLGSSEPEFHTAGDGATIVACRVKGVSLAIGDGGICQNVEGGHVSETFAALWNGTVGAALNAAAGIFAGFGAMGQGLAVAAPAPPEPRQEAPPARVYEPEASVPEWATE